MPGHDVDSLKIAQVYNIEKSGCVDLDGKFKSDDVGTRFAKLNVKDEKTNEFIIKSLDQDDFLFRSFKYQNVGFRDNTNGERIVMLTKDSWFMRISDKLKMRCL